MNSSTSLSCASRVALTLLLTVVAVSFSVAQAPAPTPDPSPAASPAPAGTPPPPVVTAGLPSQSGLDAYNAARTPVASVLLSQPGAKSVDAAANASHRASAAEPAAPLQPVATGGVFPQIDLSAPAPGTGVSVAKGTRASAATTSAATPPLATVTLSYDASWAGNLVRVQVLGGHGGTLSATGGDGQTVQVNDSFFLTLDAAGQATFAFQAPATPNTYQVLTRLENVETVFNFLVPDPEP